MDVFLILVIIFFSFVGLFIIILIGSIIYAKLYSYNIPSTKIRRLRNKCIDYKNKIESKIEKINYKVQLANNLDYLKKHNLLEEFYVKQDKKGIKRVK